MTNKLLLLDIFLLLRQKGINLTLEQYYTMLRALEGGFGLENIQAFERLCCSLWIRSPEEKEIFLECLHRDDLEKAMAQINPQDLTTTSVTQAEIKREIKPVKESETQKQNNIYQTNKTGANSDQSLYNQPKELKKIEPAAIRQPRYSQSFSKQPQSYKKIKIRDFPVTPRVVQQSLRSLGAKIKTESLEIDMESTVKSFSQEGFMVKPVTRQEWVTQLKLLIMVDKNSCMKPFAPLIEEFLKILSDMECSNLLIYYFTAYPGDYLYYLDPQMNSKRISQVWDEISGQNILGVILSDGGAANREYSKKRLDKTKDFLRELSGKVKKVIWLNPTPKNRWTDTSAIEIAKIVKMLELSDLGLRSR